MTFRVPFVVAAVVALVSPAAAAPSTAKSNDNATNLPMVFYLAKGEPDACGQGCSEWIAAEGQIDQSTAQRLRTFLNRLGKRRLPIYFHSPGGNGVTAMEMGRLLREREMTAGVSQTIPADCAAASPPACRALKQKAQVLPSTLRVGSCNSACVFALIGAKVRQVPPGARLGVHSAKVIVMRSDGRKVNYSDRQVASFQKAKLTELNARLRRYVQEMKVDVRLFDLGAQVPPETVQYLTRDEIVRFGIDTRESQETRWDLIEPARSEPWAMKLFVQTATDGSKQLRTSFIQIACASKTSLFRGPQGARVTYFRHVGLSEKEKKATITIAAGDRKSTLFGSGSLIKLDAIEPGGSYNAWTTFVPFDFLEAATLETIEISEQNGPSAAPHVIRLSTAGMAQAIPALRQRCSASSDCQTSDSNGGSSEAICNVPDVGH